MRDIKRIVSTGLGTVILMTGFSAAEATTDSTSTIPPVTTPGRSIFLDKGMASIFTKDEDKAFPTTTKRCPVQMHPSVVLSSLGSAYPTEGKNWFYATWIDCGEPDKNDPNYKITCKNAWVWFEGATAAVFLGWNIYCVPDI